jgi:hypothetical protein
MALGIAVLTRPSLAADCLSRTSALLRCVLQPLHRPLL